jgi:hypothetical protein
MKDLFICVRFDGHKELTQMGKLFLELEKSHNALISLSYDDETDDVFSFNCAVDCAVSDFGRALMNLKVHCASVERSAQMAGVM